MKNRNVMILSGVRKKDEFAECVTSQKKTPEYF